MKYFIDAVKRYVDFSGRARRKEYWMYVLFYMIFAIAVGIVAGIIRMPLLTSLYSLALFLPTLGVSVRRLHDLGKSGWWFLLGLIPVIGGIILLIWFCTEGEQANNQYGPNPKAV